MIKLLSFWSIDSRSSLSSKHRNSSRTNTRIILNTFIHFCNIVSSNFFFLQVGVEYTAVNRKVVYVLLDVCISEKRREKITDQGKQLTNWQPTVFGIYAQMPKSNFDISRTVRHWRKVNWLINLWIHVPHISVVMCNILSYWQIWNILLLSQTITKNFQLLLSC